MFFFRGGVEVRENFILFEGDPRVVGGEGSPHPCTPKWRNLFGKAWFTPSKWPLSFGAFGRMGHVSPTFEPPPPKRIFVPNHPRTSGTPPKWLENGREYAKIWRKIFVYWPPFFLSEFCLPMRFAHRFK